MTFFGLDLGFLDRSITSVSVCIRSVVARLLLLLLLLLFNHHHHHRRRVIVVLMMDFEGFSSKNLLTHVYRFSRP